MAWTRPMCVRSVQCIISRPSRHFSGKAPTWCHEELIFKNNTLCCVNTKKCANANVFCKFSMFLRQRMSLFAVPLTGCKTPSYLPTYPFKDGWKQIISCWHGGVSWWYSLSSCLFVDRSDFAARSIQTGLQLVWEGAQVQRLRHNGCSVTAAREWVHQQQTAFPLAGIEGSAQPLSSKPPPLWLL